MESQDTNIFLDTWFPIQIDLVTFPHIKLTSRQPWNPHQIEFPSTKYYAKEEIEGQNVSNIGIKFHQSIEDHERQITDEEGIIFNTQRFNQILVASVQISGIQEIVIESATREQQRQVSKLVTEKLVKYIHIHADLSTMTVYLSESNPIYYSYSTIEDSIWHILSFEIVQ